MPHFTESRSRHAWKCRGYPFVGGRETKLTRRIHKAGALATMTALLTLGLAACSGGPTPTCNPSGAQLHIAVEKGTHGRFNTKCLAAPADQPFTIEFENQDTSLDGNHNIHIFDGGTLFVGDIALHETSITYEVDPLEAGTFRFRCDNHPGMNGTFVVK
jgi:plastocyanin